ncbi:uncharacterized protein Z518_00432 [Rhinocladiella mackenziei CBS 650.93]|uniref:Lipoyl-binding domain-containing protein n=1 Tax=Rhinocladiella mackenziei CBS 650.93 TaxID=1442369 RepID=A0A0D2HF79_9EURO|nr:uncharacterized protein Z518_00432 [Rhinocladiella mackenziei CBS 650.93]KIX09353.1 hypothetical protein Z518_00432 [Rhinocladiella mackenziei CBS 650.93]
MYIQSDTDLLDHDRWREIVAKSFVEMQYGEFISRHCSALWLEKNLAAVLERGSEIMRHVASLPTKNLGSSRNGSDSASAGTGLGKGDAFTITLDQDGSRSTKTGECLLKLDRVRVNDFPTEVSADIIIQSSISGTRKYAATMSMASQTSVMSATHRIGDRSDPSHVCLPFSGQFAELVVDEGDIVRENDLLCVVKQMKMELEVRAPYAGVVTWVRDVEEGETVNEGVLICTLRRAETEPKRNVRPEISPKI